MCTYAFGRGYFPTIFNNRNEKVFKPAVANHLKTRKRCNKIKSNIAVKTRQKKNHRQLTGFNRYFGSKAALFNTIRVVMIYVCCSSNLTLQTRVLQSLRLKAARTFQMLAFVFRGKLFTQTNQFPFAFPCEFQ